MTHSYKLVDSAGSTLIDLSSSTYLVTNYQPNYAAGQVVVAETMDIVVTGSAPSVITSAVSALQNKMTLLDDYQYTGSGGRVYLQFTGNLTTDAWRTELVTGNVLSTPSYLGGGKWDRARPTSFVFTRRNYWEGAEQTLTLTNANGSGSNGLAVYPANDWIGSAGSKRCNYIEWSGSQLGGDLPAGAKLTVEVVTVGATIENLHAGVLDERRSGSISGGSSSSFFYLEGESYTTGASGSIIASAGYSSGSAGAFVVGTSEAFIGLWRLTSATLIKMMGKPYRILAKLVSNLSGAEVRPVLKWNASTTLFSGEKVALNSDLLVDFGTLFLPPFLPDKAFASSAFASIDLMLYGNYTSASVIYIDYLCLVPVENYGHVYDVVGIPTSGVLTIDGIEGRVYATDGSGNLQKSQTLEGSYPSLYPGRDGAIVLQYDHSISDRCKATLYARPRRRMP